MYKGSTNQKTGESMEKPGKKLKKFLIITGTTGLVYAGLKYLLPLWAPSVRKVPQRLLCFKFNNSCVKSV